MKNVIDLPSILQTCMSYTTYNELESLLDAVFDDDIFFNEHYRKVELQIADYISSNDLEEEVYSNIEWNPLHQESQMGYVNTLKSTADILSGILHYFFKRIEFEKGE